MSLVIGCKKIQAGSNKGVIKLTDGVERYSDDEMSDEGAAEVGAMHGEKMPSDTTKVMAQPVQVVKKDSAMEVKNPAAEEKK